jgi:lipoprotein-releasing system permease protein
MSSRNFSRSVALRYLWSTRRDAAIWVITLFSILGVAIGVIVLNITMAVFSGFQSELRSKILGADAHIVVRSIGGSLREWQNAKEKISKVTGVKSVSGFTQHQALLKAGERASGLLIRGLEENSASAKQVESYLGGKRIDALFHPPPTTVYLEDGSPDEVPLPGILIGQELIRSAGILVGSQVSLLAPEVSSSPFGLVPRFRRFTVVGSYKSGLIEYESGLAYMALKDAQDFFRVPDEVTGLEVRVDDIDRAPQIAEQIVSALGGLSSGFIAQDWTSTNRPFFEALNLEKRVYFLVLLLIILMASFSIVSSLIMIVLEKRKDIAVLRTLGASTRSIGRIFRFQGAVIGGIGVSLGVIGGYIGCLLLQKYGFPIDERIFQMSTLPIRIEPWNFVLTAVCAFLICYLATIYPALRAMRLQPTEVLRYE